MDPIQLVIIFVSVALTTLMIFLGVQMWYILREFKRSIEKVNKMLDDAGKISGAVGEGVSSLSGFSSGLKAGIAMIKSLKGSGGDDDDE